MLYELLINTRPKLMECVNRALDIFEKTYPERGKSYQNAIRKKTIMEIALELDKTIGATKKFLYETRKNYLNIDLMEKCLDYV